MIEMKPTLSFEAASFSFWNEPAGIWGNAVTSQSPLEQLGVTHDTTDYLWYVRDINLANTVSLSVQNAQDLVYCYVDGKSCGHSQSNPATFDLSSFSKGNHKLQLLTMTMGLINYGLHMETVKKGIQGRVTLGSTDLTQGSWQHQAGLKGESLKIYTLAGAANITWNNNPSAGKNQPLTWWRASFDLPSATPGTPFALDMTGMNKGFVWVNGHGLGRYYMIIGNGGGSCSCDYAGSFGPGKCRVDCGKPSQQYYHVPRDWLNPTNNLVVFFEEIGGDPSTVELVARTQGAICDDKPEDWPAEDTSVNLGCPPGTVITSVEFASFGTPSGSCGSYQLGNCNAANSTAIVEKQCLKQSGCTVPVSVNVFGDPCPTTSKSLAVQVICQ